MDILLKEACCDVDEDMGLVMWCGKIQMAGGVTTRDKDEDIEEDIFTFIR